MNHAGTINANETWHLTDSPHYITGDLTISAGVTVTFEPGIEIRFCKVSGAIRLLVYGGIEAAANYFLPVTITVNTENDGVHGYFDKPRISAYSSDNYCVRFMNNTTPTLLRYVHFKKINSVYFQQSVNFLSSHTIEYCNFDCYMPLYVLYSSKVKIDHSVIHSYSYKIILGQSAELYMNWCEFFTSDYFAYTYAPNSKIYLTYCLLHSGHRTGTASMGGALIDYDHCFIAVDALEIIPVNVSSSAGNPSQNNIRDSLIYVRGLSPSAAAVFNITGTYTSFSSLRNQYQGIDNTQRKAIVGVTAGNTLSNLDYMADCAAGVLGNIDMTNTPAGGSSANDPAMFTLVTRTNAVNTKYYRDEVSDRAESGLSTEGITITWKTLTPSRTRLYFKKSSDSTWNVIEKAQDWTGRTGNKYAMNAAGEWSGHSITLTGLTDGTTYKYKIAGMNILGEEFGDNTEHEFTTEAIPTTTDRTFTETITGDVSRIQHIYGDLS